MGKISPEKQLQVRVKLIKERYCTKGPIIRSPEDVAKLVHYLETEDREHFLCIHLDTKNKVLGIETVSIGSLNSSLISPREVFKAAILSNCCGIICVHNHPSGDVEESEDDVKITKQLAEAGRLLGIEVLDHVIIGHGKHASLKDKGLI